MLYCDQRRYICIAVALYKKFGRTALFELAVAGMYVHTLDYAKGRKIEIITRNYEIVVLRHCSILHIFHVLP